MTNPGRFCGPYQKTGSKNSTDMAAKVFAAAPAGAECGWRRPSVKESIWSERKKLSPNRWPMWRWGARSALTMIEDGMKELEKEEEIKTQDICELVAKNMA